MMRKHTSGPWVFRRHWGGSGAYEICHANTGIAFAQTANSYDEEDRANARLMAAAPELLDLVEMVRSCFGGGRTITFSDQDIELFSAVIDKATGSCDEQDQ